jgi:AcrR family transcriptional regulator
MKRKEVNRQKAIDSTLALCLKHSFHGTSIDAITAATGMSKATIYRHFQSKEQLIEEALDFYRKESLQALSSMYNSSHLTLDEKLSSPFAMLKNAYNKETFMGCCIQKASNEYSNDDEPSISKVCTSFKKERIHLVETLLEQNNIAHAKEKALKGDIILSGLLSNLQINFDEELIDMAHSMYINIMKS